MCSEISGSDLTEREQHLLRVLVQEYIRKGEPVGSKALAQVAGLDLSPASLRIVMADLESYGFLHSPHTSAGRVPTAKGYRMFVDSLVAAREVDDSGFQELRRHLEDEGADTPALMSNVSGFLSGITRMASLVTLPRLQSLQLRQVEFLPLSENRVLAILVTNEREIQNRVLRLPRAFNPSELQQIANYLTAQFAGKEISQVRSDLLAELRSTRESMDRLMREAVDMAERLFAAPREEDGVLFQGQTNLMDFEELSNVGKLRQLFDAFNRKRDMLQLLDHCLTAQGVQIFIGEESGYAILDDCSLITSTYSVGDKVLGVLGVIGPTRMPYDRVIPVVDLTAKLLGAALNSR